MNKVTWLLCVLFVLALAFSYCDGKRQKKISDELDDIIKVERIAIPVKEAGDPQDGSSWRHKEGENKDGHRWKGHHKDGHKNGDKEEDKDEHHWGEHHKEGHHWGGYRHMREYFRHKFANLSMHFVDDSLPPSVYIVLADKGIEVKAIYEAFGNTTAITKVGVRVADKNLVVSTNGNLAVDGVQSSVSEFQPVEFENGSIKKERREKLVVTYGPYQIFMKVHPPFEHNDKNSSYVPHISLFVGVQKSAKVAPSGFIGARISVDPAQYISPETIV